MTWDIRTDPTAETFTPLETAVLTSYVETQTRAVLFREFAIYWSGRGDHREAQHTRENRLKEQHTTRYLARMIRSYIPDGRDLIQRMDAAAEASALAKAHRQCAQWDYEARHGGNNEQERITLRIVRGTNPMVETSGDTEGGPD